MTCDMKLSDICILIFIRQVFSPAKVVFAAVGVLLSVSILLNKISWAIITPPSLRQLRMPKQAKTPLSTFLGVLKCFSDV
jgi:hypothetical protein